MNESIEHELRVCVERCVRPIRASNRCKDRMRSELFAHLHGVFEDERLSVETDEAALEKTRQRFGDPANICAELQGTVPWIVRLMCAPLDRRGRWYRRPHESAIRYDFRVMLWVGAFSALFYTALVVVAMVLRSGMNRPRALPGMLAAGVLACMLAPTFVLLNSAKRESLRRMGQWKWARLVSFAVSAVTGVFTLAAIISILALMNWTGRVALFDLTNPFLIGGALLIGPLVLEIQGRFSLIDCLRFERWGCLEID